MVSIIPPIGPIDYTPIDPAEQEPKYLPGSTTPERRGTPTPRIPFTPPVDSDGYIPVELITPHRDPPNTFRASNVEDMFRIVPSVNIYWNDLEIEGDTGIASFKFHTGVPSDIRSVIVTFQNRTLNTSLNVNLDLPNYLRCELGTEFIIPHRGDTVTPPVVVMPPIIKGTGSMVTYDPDRFETSTLKEIFLTPRIKTIGRQPVETTDWEGTGKGIINIVLLFSDAQANQMNPGLLEDEIIFRITPVGVMGPAYVDINAAVPPDLNKELEEDPDRRLPRDDDELEDPNAPDTPETIIEYVDRRVEVSIPDNRLRWIDGTTGEPNEGPPPDGWYAGTDGRMYPPLITDPCAVSGSGGSPFPEPGAEDLTELQDLMIRSLEQISPTYGSVTKRNGYVVDADAYFEGIDTSRILRRIPELVIADSVEDENKFQIITISDEWPDGTDVVTTMQLVEWTRDVSLMVAYMKEGAKPRTAPRPIFGGFTTTTELSYWQNEMYEWTLRFQNGHVEYIHATLMREEEQWNLRGAALAAQLLAGIEATGEGEGWEILRDRYEDHLDPYPGVLDSENPVSTPVGTSPTLTTPTAPDTTSTTPVEDPTLEEQIEEKVETWIDRIFNR